VLRCLQCDTPEGIFDLFDLGFEVLESTFELLMLEDQVLECVNVSGEVSDNSFVDNAFSFIKFLLQRRDMVVEDAGLVLAFLYNKTFSSNKNFKNDSIIALTFSSRPFFEFVEKSINFVHFSFQASQLRI
jgi:hypothetical protein